MAETKEIEQNKVLAGTFPASCADQAKKLEASLKEAKIAGFKIREGMPGYIQVIAECKDKKAAEDLIKAGAENKFNFCMAE